MTKEKLKQLENIVENGDLLDRMSIALDIRVYITELEATIEAQNIIIRDKTAIMEAMVQPKTCDGCVYIDRQSYQKPCNDCVRMFSDNDHYEPKAQQ